MSSKDEDINISFRSPTKQLKRTRDYELDTTK